MIFKENMISVVIPMYNSESSIEAVLDSICAQTKKKFIKEIIVVNDGSTDNSREIVESYSRKSILPITLLNKTNGGVSSARNEGMLNSKGSWIAFCDSDDTWFPEKIESQVKTINENDEIDFLGGNHLNEATKILYRPITNLFKLSVKILCVKSLPQPSTVLMKKQIFNEIGGFDVNQRYAEDGNYFLKVVKKYNCYYSPIQVVCYSFNKRGYGVSGLSKNLKAMHKGTLKNLKEMLEDASISKSFYFLMFIFYHIKFIRRIFHTYIIQILWK